MAKIAIDAGHGLYTAGKRCLKSLDPNETREWTLNNRVANALGEYLKSAGHTILRVDDADGSTDVPLADRVKKANNWGADAYVSVHHNAGINGGSGGGTVVYVGTGNQPKSTVLQNAVYKHAIAEANLKGNRSDGTLAASFYVVMNTNMPAILVECGFMDSSTDIKYILDANWSKKMGLGIAKGVCEVHGGTVKNSAATSASATTTNAGSNQTSGSSSAYYSKYTGSSGAIDTVLAAIGVESAYRGSWSKRKPLTEANGISGYTGTASQNTSLISLAKNGKLRRVTAASNSAYYAKYTGTSGQIDVVLKTIGVPASYYGSWSKRKPIAAKNGISNYTGTAAQNTTLINLAKQGKLKKV